MTPITYLTGDATNPTTSGPRIIGHICNDIGGWGKGFVLAISNRWSEPESKYREWYAERESNDFALGSVQFVSVAANLWVANMIAQHKIQRGNDGTPPIRYDAVGSCLAQLALFAAEHHASVHMPRIGCGLAGGKWDEIEPLIDRTCSDANVPVFVYDFTP
ncbi:MAG: macro domain-containing protein [Planctomycetota bacterium]|nr:macro domain-containing protein [Planctomycetota bacterium]MDA1178058.1 macro domain-containing protein [Planctomycetota bacterium]